MIDILLIPQMENSLPMMFSHCFINSNKQEVETKPIPDAITEICLSNDVFVAFWSTIEPHRTPPQAAQKVVVHFRFKIKYRLSPNEFSQMLKIERLH